MANPTTKKGRYEADNDVQTTQQRGSFPTETYVTPVTGPTRSVHSGGYQVPFSRLEDHKQSFFPRTVRDWNALPASTASAPSTDAFRRHLMESRG